jgi:hypothetical protein
MTELDALRNKIKDDEINRRDNQIYKREKNNHSLGIKAPV